MGALGHCIHEITAAVVTVISSRLGPSAFHHGYRRAFLLEEPLTVSGYWRRGVVFSSGVATCQLLMLW